MPHDPLCPCKPDATGYAAALCRCELIAKARADERERIAQAIEHHRAIWDADWRGLAEAGATVGPGTVRVTYDECARIARNGGRA